MMLLTRQLAYSFTKNNLQKFKAYKFLKPTILAEQNKKLAELQTPEENIPHSWGQYYFTPFLLPITILGYTFIATHQQYLPLVNLVTASTLVPFAVTNILFYWYPFKSAASSNVYKVVNLIGGAGMCACLYLYQAEPLIALSASLGVNLVTGFTEYFTRIREERQDEKSVKGQEVEDAETEGAKLKRSRMQLMMIIFRFFSSTLLLFNLTFLAQINYSKSPPPLIPSIPLPPLNPPHSPQSPTGQNK